MRKLDELFVETAKLNPFGFPYAYDLRPATQEDVEFFTKRGCEHSNPKQTDNLVYDEYHPIYDSRFCAVCNQFLNYV